MPSTSLGGRITQPSSSSGGGEGGGGSGAADDGPGSSIAGGNVRGWGFGRRSEHGMGGRWGLVVLW